MSVSAAQKVLGGPGEIPGGRGQRSTQAADPELCATSAHLTDFELARFVVLKKDKA